MAWSVDRLGRSLQDLVHFLDHLRSTRVELFLHQQGLDTTSPAGRAMFGMLSVFSEFERAIIQERIAAGMARAKAKGTKSGKPIGRPRIAPPIKDRIRAAHRAGGASLRDLAAQFGWAGDCASYLVWRRRDPLTLVSSAVREHNLLPWTIQIPLGRTAVPVWKGGIGLGEAVGSRRDSGAEGLCPRQADEWLEDVARH